MLDLNYKPKLEYDKNYDTEGMPQSDNSYSYQEDNSREENPNTILKLINSLNSIKNIMSALPAPIFNAIDIPIAGVQYVIGTIDPNGFDDNTSKDNKIIIEIEKKPKPFIPITKPKDSITAPDSSEDVELDPTEDTSNSNEDDIEFPDSFFSDNEDNIQVKVKDISKKEIARKQYEIDLISIFEDFTIKLEHSLNNYLTNFLTIAQETEIPDPFILHHKYKGKSSDLKNKNLVPLSDTIIGLQIVRDQKLRLFSKLFDIDETIMHIRSCKIASELKSRYFDNEYVKNSTLSDIVINQSISDLRSNYDKKYEENFYNLYKYLNSTVILIDECLMMFLKESQAKAILIKREGIKI